MTDQEWDDVAAHMRIVACQAYLRGFSSGWQERGGGPVPYDVSMREADMYAASGFDVETVKDFHVRAARSLSRTTR